MKYGYFSKDGKEYILTDPNTPRPWINFLTNEEYCAVISATGGGYSFYKDSRNERMLWWLGPNLYKDRPGRYVFVRDEQTKEVFSITWQPLRKQYDSFEARIGFGYQVIRSSRNKISGEITYFVPRKEHCEIWKVKIKNGSGKTRKLNLFGYVEFFIGNWDYITYYNIATLWNRVGLDKKSNSIIARKTAFYQEFNIKNNPYQVFFTSSEKADSWDANKYRFLGRYNTEENPECVFNGKCTESICDGEEPVGVLQHNITLKPGEEKTIIYILGQTSSEEEFDRILKMYKTPKNVDQELTEVKKFWETAIGNVKVETPDKEFDNIANYWVKYQLYMCNYWSRSPSFYHEGQGGRGYRDSCQDAEGILALNTKHAKEKILKIASLTRRDGTVAPGWSDTYGKYHNRPFKDHPTWLTSTVIAYVKETGDLSILDKKVVWIKDMWRDGGTKRDINWDKGTVDDGDGTLFEHLLAQLNFTYNDVSVHGIPRVGEADWNDALDMAGRRQIGESVWLAMALVRSLKFLAELAEIKGESTIATDLREKAEVMAGRINEYGWDGRWYIAGYNDDLVPFGSNKNSEGKIFLNSQSWAILSGIVPPDRLPLVLDSVDKKLKYKHGLALLAPAYSVFDPGLGRIAMFSKGTKENAAVFCHAHVFMAVAYAAAGLGTKAYESICQIMPNKQHDVELYKTEPYVFSEYLIGPDHPYAHGEGAFTWLTGTAGWTFLFITEWILGVKREYKGLRIQPCIPAKWKKCRITRDFRGATYEISIENPNGVETGIREIYVDGKRADSNLIKPHGDGKVHDVRVVMG